MYLTDADKPDWIAGKWSTYLRVAYRAAFVAFGGTVIPAFTLMTDGGDSVAVIIVGGIVAWNLLYIYWIVFGLMVPANEYTFKYTQRWMVGTDLSFIIGCACFGFANEAYALSMLLAYPIMLVTPGVLASIYSGKAKREQERMKDILPAIK